jgi:1-acyl-sn-glycerol-3-phosphate acyltransferase
MLKSGMHDVAALTFFALLAAAIIIWAVRGFRRSPYTVAQTLLWMPALVLVRVLWRGQLPNGLPLPENQGAVIVSNHRSSIDPFFVQVIAHRDVHWMVAKEYCESAAFGWFLRLVEVIPVSRGGIDTAATKLAIRHVQNGKVVGMFPEGRINMTDELLLPGRPGAAMIALQAGVPLLPCYIEGSPYDRTAWSPFTMTAKTRVRFGRLIDTTPYLDRAEDREVHAELTLRAMKEIARLAEQPDFEPRLAGRNWKPTQEELDALHKQARRRA